VTLVSARHGLLQFPLRPYTVPYHVVGRSEDANGEHGASSLEGDAGKAPEQEDREHSLQLWKKSERPFRSSQNPVDAELGNQESDRGDLRIAERQEQVRDATMEKVQPRGRLIEREGKVRCEAHRAPEKAETEEGERVSFVPHGS
jgi:hypothetical protein